MAQVQREKDRAIARRSFLLGAMASGVGLACPMVRASERVSSLMLVGTSTDGKSTSKGIYAFRWDTDTGVAKSLGLAAETRDPQFLVRSPNRRFVYSVNEISNYQGTRTGSVSAFRVDTTDGRLILLDVVSSAAGGPCNLTIDHTGSVVFVADGAGGSLASYRVLKDGTLSDPVSVFHFSGHSVDLRRQKGPWTHCATISPDNKHLLVNDLGLDHITIYSFDSKTAVLTPNPRPPYSTIAGSGPRNLMFHPNGRWVYSVNEMGNSIDCMEWDTGAGILSRFQNVSTLRPDFAGQNTAATVQIESTGRFLYVSNRGANNVAAFAVSPSDGTLKQIGQVSCGGTTPRHIALDPSENWILASNQTSSSVTALRRDKTTGLLDPAEHEVIVDFPTCVSFV